MKKNEILVKDLIYSGPSQTAGTRLPNDKDLYEFENGTSPLKYPKDKTLGKFTGNRGEPTKTHLFSGPFRHLFLSNNYRKSAKGIEKKGAIPTEYLAIHPVTKLAYDPRDKKHICVNDNKLEDFITAVRAMEIPSDWKAFCIHTSTSAAKELKPAKSKVTPKTKKAESNNEMIDKISDALFAKYSNWSDIPEASIKMVAENCKNFGFDIKEVRTAYNALAIPEPDQAPELNLDF